MKKYSLGILAIVFAIAGSAFTTKKATAEKWFVYAGPDQSLTELQDASNYESPADEQPCSGDEQVCGIYFIQDDLDLTRPEDFDAPMLEKIRAVVEDHETEAEVAQQQ